MFLVDQANECIEEAVQAAVQKVGQGISLSDSVYDLDNVRSCLGTEEIKGVDILGCVYSEAIGNLPVGIEEVLRDPVRAVSCSKTSPDDLEAANECSGIVNYDVLLGVSS